MRIKKICFSKYEYHQLIWGKGLSLTIVLILLFSSACATKNFDPSKKNDSINEGKHTSTQSVIKPEPPNPYEPSYPEELHLGVIIKDWVVVENRIQGDMRDLSGLRFARKNFYMNRLVAIFTDKENYSIKYISELPIDKRAGRHILFLERIHNQQFSLTNKPAPPEVIKLEIMTKNAVIVDAVVRLDPVFGKFSLTEFDKVNKVGTLTGVLHPGKMWFFKLPKVEKNSGTKFFTLTAVIDE